MIEPRPKIYRVIVAAKLARILPDKQPTYNAGLHYTRDDPDSFELSGGLLCTGGDLGHEKARARFYNQRGSSDER